MILSAHKISALIFLLIYLVKTVLLLANQKERLAKMTKGFKGLEMAVSFIFLATGIIMFVQVGAIKTLQIVKLVLVFASIPLAVIGFKKQNKLMAALSFLFILASYGLAEASKKKPYPSQTVATENSNDLGKATFQANCVVCHGNDGKKMFNGASDLSASQLQENDILNVVSNGRKNMPKYSGVMTEDELKAVSTYVLSLRK